MVDHIFEGQIGWIEDSGGLWLMKLFFNYVIHERFVNLFMLSSIYDVVSKKKIKLYYSILYFVCLAVAEP